MLRLSICIDVLGVVRKPVLIAVRLVLMASLRWFGDGKCFKICCGLVDDLGVLVLLLWVVVELKGWWNG